MNRSDTDFFRNWFSNYCRSFYSSDAEDQKNILLKEMHTHHVCKNTILIAGGQDLNSNQLMIAETAALFHDVGRFSQYAEYKTFRDSLSVNHGELGTRILKEKGVLRNIPADEQETVITAVKFHNAFKIPDINNLEALIFLKLIRDADKLDIWRVFLDYYEGSDKDRASAVALGMPDTPYYSTDILSCFHKKIPASLSAIKTLNDFKLLQLSWIFDLNFKTSLKVLLDRDYIGKISATLPRTDDIKKTVELLHNYIKQKLNGGTHG